ncbi:hypothetical protein NMY233_0007, partial [Neisseria meningitidis NM233]
RRCSCDRVTVVPFTAFGFEGMRASPTGTAFPGGASALPTMGTGAFNAEDGRLLGPNLSLPFM